MKVRAAVAGANGYAGMTLVNLLVRHPGVELAQLTSRSFAGQRYQSVFPLLDLDGTFREEPDANQVHVVFSCLPHNVGAGRAGSWLDAGARHRHERRLPAERSRPVSALVEPGTPGARAAGRGRLRAA